MKVIVLTTANTVAWFETDTADVSVGQEVVATFRDQEGVERTGEVTIAEINGFIHRK
ncbi:MAG: hypothetical protein ACRCTP_04065 [Aeromonas popoffii]|uniref:hypothetical protein n=1 Tax=Aeromonas popoffii TaxID=70856 RepID=UPI003F319C21